MADVNWDAPPVESGINATLWKSLHARHCGKCSELTIDDDCYFRLVHHFLRTGFEPAMEEGTSLSDITPSRRAYVNKWRKEQVRCERAFKKWLKKMSNLVSEPTDTQPKVFFPLLPVVKEKDKWRYTRFATDYKVRLYMDLANGDMNDRFKD